MTTFAKRVLSILRRIPPGRVATYGDVARLAGKPGAARAVGNVLRGGPEPGLPYHRVIASGGKIGGYGRDPALKRALLAAEGHVVRRHRVARFDAVRWPGRSEPAPRTAGPRQPGKRSAGAVPRNGTATRRRRLLV